MEKLFQSPFCGGVIAVLPAKYVVCPECNGTGTELGHGLKGVCIDEDSLNDSDFMESYMGGAFDVRCSTCQGDRVVAEFDVVRMSFAQKRLAVAIRRDIRAEIQGQWEDAMTRRAECGYQE